MSAAVTMLPPGPVMAPDPKAAYEAARAAALACGDLRLANAYYIIADLVRELEDERAESARLRAMLAEHKVPAFARETVPAGRPT